MKHSYKIQERIIISEDTLKSFSVNLGWGRVDIRLRG